MDIMVDLASDPALTEVSLVRGGPLYRAERAVRLIQEDRWCVVRRTLVFVAVSWLPLLLITVIFNREAIRSFLVDYRVHARLCIAVPALLLGEIVMDSRLREIFGYIRRADLLDAPGMAYMDEVAKKLVRLRDGFLPELLIAILIVVRLVWRYRGLVDTTPWMGQEIGSGYRFTAAGWYGVFVSAPIFNFLLALALWRWCLWTFFAFRLSRQNLKLVAIHPDDRGGLNFLSLSIMAFAPVAFAAATVIASTWRHNVLHHGIRLLSLKLDAIVLVAIIFVIALGPLLFFVPPLTALRRVGLLDYGILGQLQSTNFQDRWVQQRAGLEGEFVLSTEINGLAGFGRKFEQIGKLLPFPATKQSLYPLAIALAIPALTVILTEIPLRIVLEDLFKALH